MTVAARLAHGAQAADVVPVAVGEDDVLDRRVRHLAQRRHRLARALFGRAAVDGDDHLGRRRRPGSKSRSPRRRRRPRPREPGASRRSGIRALHRPRGSRAPAAWWGRRESRGPRAQHLARARAVTQRAIGDGELAIDAAIESERKLVADAPGWPPGRSRRLRALSKRAGSSANTCPRANRPSTGSLAAPSSSLWMASSTQATRFSRPMSLATRACMMACNERKSGSALRLLGRQSTEVVVALPLAVVGDELLHRDQDQERLRVGVGRRFHQRGRAGVARSTAASKAEPWNKPKSAKIASSSSAQRCEPCGWREKAS